MPKNIRQFKTNTYFCIVIGFSEFKSETKRETGENPVQYPLLYAL